MALLTVKDVSAWLQMKPATVYVWVAEGKMPALKIQGLIRFRRDDIEAWLKRCQIEQSRPSRSAERRRHGIDHVDALIAEIKADVYTSSYGKPDQSRATRKEDSNGSV
jgi:excisionase family DNA binding protein